MGTVAAFRDVVRESDSLMGVKAVWGPTRKPVLTFPSQGKTENARLAKAKSAAERALQRPWIITVGAGKEVEASRDGRVLCLVRGTGVYGETSAFIRGSLDPRWPVSIVLTEVFSVMGEPHLIKDLGFLDRKLLSNASGVVRPARRFGQLWEALKDWEIERLWEVNLPGFRDPGELQLCRETYPRVEGASTEGRRCWTISKKIERDRKLVHLAKARNREQNGGTLKCEACDFTDQLDAMFDAHHIEPLSAGVRESRDDDLAVLCPTCHRWVHAKAKDTLSPVPIREIKDARFRIRSCQEAELVE